MVSAVSPASVCPDGRLAHCAQWSHRSICQALAANRRWEWATCGTGMGVPGGRGAPGLWSWTGAGVPGGERNPAPLVLSPRCADRGPSSAWGFFHSHRRLLSQILEPRVAREGESKKVELSVIELEVDGQSPASCALCNSKAFYSILRNTRQ